MNDYKETISPVVLSLEEKHTICLALAIHLPNLRKLIHLSMKGCDIMLGFPMNTIYRVENGVQSLTWTQVMALTMLFSVNRATKEYMFLHRIPGHRFLQYLQQINEDFPPEVCITVNKYLVATYNEIKEDNQKRKVE